MVSRRSVVKIDPAAAALSRDRRCAVLTGVGAVATAQAPAGASVAVIGLGAGIWTAARLLRHIIAAPPIANAQ